MESSILDLYSVNEVELIYKRKADTENRVEISDPDTAYKVLKSTWDENRIGLVEQFKMILLDHASTCLGICDVATGGMSSCVVDPKMVFAVALKSKATSIILAHNHPSGNLQPSKADVEITRRLAEGGKLLDIPVIEHIIMTSNGYYSMASKGFIP